MYVFVLQSITVSALVQMRSCQMNAVWHRCFGGYYYLTNAHENVVHQELFWQNNRDCISFFSETPADAVAIVWFWLNVHKCICNGVSVYCVFSDCVLKAVIHDCFPCLLTGFLRSCEAERGCQPWGWEATEIFNKVPVGLEFTGHHTFTQACAYIHTPTHTHTVNTQLLILRRIDCCLPGRQI